MHAGPRTGNWNELQSLAVQAIYRNVLTVKILCAEIADKLIVAAPET
jgi:hypothetical protein